MRLLNVVALVALVASSPATAGRLSITDAALTSRGGYDALAARGRTSCIDEGVVLRNASARSVAVDLYEAQTDVAFPYGTIRPGSHRRVPLTRPARIVVVDHATGRALDVLDVRDCR